MHIITFLLVAGLLQVTEPLYPLTIQGRLFLTDDTLEFRGCDTAELFLIKAKFTVHDTLYQFMQSQSDHASDALYIRFRGSRIRDDEDLPERYADILQIDVLLEYSTVIPITCD